MSVLCPDTHPCVGMPSGRARAPCVLSEESDLPATRAEATGDLYWDWEPSAGRECQGKLGICQLADSPLYSSWGSLPSFKATAKDKEQKVKKKHSGWRREVN